jgi:tetratricopeptide (TPR) repeat protein
MIDTQLQRAQLLFQQERYDLAQRELVELLSTSPDHGPALVLLALCRLQQEDIEEAESIARQAIAASPDEPFPFYGLALVLEQRRKYEEAETAIGSAIALDPYDADYHSLQARLRFAREDWEGALAAADRALDCDPEHIAGQNLRASAMKKLGRSGEAAQQLRTALERDPEDPWTHANLGWTYLEQGDHAKAEEHFREALRLDPTLDYARQGVIHTLKSSSFFYRRWLDYAFWMARQTTMVRWGIIISLVVGVQVISRMGDLDPTLQLIAGPIVLLYVGFVLTSILMTPITNMLFAFHPFGRLALTDEEKIEAYGVAALFVPGMIAATIGYFGPPLVWLFAWPLGVGLLSTLVPFALTNRLEEGRGREIMRWYAYAVGSAALLYVGAMYWGIASAILANSKEQAQALGETIGYSTYLIIAAAAATWLVNILGSQRWQR